MAKKSVLTFCYYIASVPFFLVSIILVTFNFWDIKKDLVLCLQTIEKQKNNNLSDNLLNILVIAEDHRNFFHKGVDHFALLRALSVRLIFGKVQGASTIEQQFVRVVTCRYERTLSRKLREQILATTVLTRSTKFDIAVSYLSIAFYGSGIYGITGLKKICDEPLSEVSINQAVKVVARLKYPEPSNQTQEWKDKIFFRNQHIHQLLNNAAIPGRPGNPAMV
ncbi:MAG: membrane carboxypeptidase/penicillin-binding protein [Desulforhopalus sp.]|jgi:membrane carboxypeptidase/penicillin-binding protein